MNTLDRPPEFFVDPFIVAQRQRPSQFVPCPYCHGDQWIETSIDGSGIGHGYPCRRCVNGHIEVQS